MLLINKYLIKKKNMHFANFELLEPGLITSLIKYLTKKKKTYFANFEFLKPGLLTSLIKCLVVPAPARISILPKDTRII